ncbi:MAG: heparinase II/III family protein [Saprospiraceae bacterium]|nr:heparinase II/III family protein [Saprospiraceae bacterium]
MFKNSKNILLVLCLGVLTIAVSGNSVRDLLQKEAEEIDLEKVLISDFSELRFPTYLDRNFWDQIPEIMRSDYIKHAEEYLVFDWPVVKATDYLEIIRSGARNSEAYAAPRAAITALVMGELIEGEGRFIDQIVNGSWYYCEQTWWGWSAHLKNGKMPNGLPDPVEPLLDLGVGEITNILSWTWFLFNGEFDKIHPLISKRLKDEIMKKAVIPYYDREDLWWMGLDIPRKVNNWVPWVNHNMLTAILILEDDQIQKIKGVQKVLRGVDVFINQYPDDGGCDEGPSYWGHAGAALYENLDLLKRATGGKFDLFDHPLIKNIGSYIYKAYIDYPYFINFADADATTGSRPQIIYSYGKDINDPIMENFGVFLAKKQGWGESSFSGKINEQIMQLLNFEEIESRPGANALIKDFWLPDTEVAGARDQAGSSDGFFFAAKGGNNNESHNHNDVGSCVMYYNGKPCLIDLGRETYVAKTFSKDRYDIWTMQSQYHNTPRINGQDQLPGKAFMGRNSTFRADSRKAIFKTDIAGAYTEDAGVKKWERNYILERGESFRIRDTYEFMKIGDSPTTLNLISYCKVSQGVPGQLYLDGDGFKLTLEYNPRTATPKIEFYEVTEAGLKRFWPDGITRIVFELIDLSIEGENELVIREVK